MLQVATFRLSNNNDNSHDIKFGVSIISLYSPCNRHPNKWPVSLGHRQQCTHLSQKNLHHQWHLPGMPSISPSPRLSSYSSSSESLSSSVLVSLSRPSEASLLLSLPSSAITMHCSSSHCLSGGYLNKIPTDFRVQTMLYIPGTVDACYSANFSSRLAQWKYSAHGETSWKCLPQPFWHPAMLPVPL